MREADLTRKGELRSTDRKSSGFNTYRRPVKRGEENYCFYV